MTIPKDEVLRYLGWSGQELEPALSALVDETIAACLDLAKPRSTHRRFACSAADGGPVLAGAALTLPGRDIRAHLEGAAQAVLLAATLGQEVDAAIRRLSYTDMTRSLVLDAAASALIEAHCDAIQRDIADKASADGLFCGGRFSPGYGDLPLAVQPALLATLNAGRAIGLTLSPAGMMVPGKSVTAVMGLFPAPPPELRGKCNICPLRENCQYRRNET